MGFSMSIIYFVGIKKARGLPRNMRWSSVCHV